MDFNLKGNYLETDSFSISKYKSNLIGLEDNNGCQLLNSLKSGFWNSI